VTRGLLKWWRFLGPILLIIVLVRVGPAAWWRFFRRADPFWFLLACSFAVPTLLVKGLRWRILVRCGGLQLSLRESIGAYAAGMLAGAATPGRVGELVKVPHLMLRGSAFETGVGLSLFDRFVDALTLSAAASFASLAASGVQKEITLAFWGLLGGLSGGLLVFLLFFPVFEAWAVRAPLKKAIGALALIREGLVGAPALWWAGIALLTFVSLIPYFGAVALCAHALCVRIPPGELVIGVSAGSLLSLLPVTVGGIGTRDLAYVVVLGGCGIEKAQALALSNLVLGTWFFNCAFFYVASQFLLTPREGMRKDAGEVKPNGPS